MPVAKRRLKANCDTDRIVHGEALQLVVEVFDELSQQVQDFTELDDATATFAGTDGDVTLELEDDEIVADADNPGRLLLTFSAVKSAALKVGDEQDWQLSFTIGATVRKLILSESLDVVASL